MSEMRFRAFVKDKNGKIMKHCFNVNNCVVSEDGIWVDGIDFYAWVEGKKGFDVYCEAVMSFDLETYTPRHKYQR